MKYCYSKHNEANIIKCFFEQAVNVGLFLDCSMGDSLYPCVHYGNVDLQNRYAGQFVRITFIYKGEVHHTVVNSTKETMRGLKETRL